MNTCLVPAHDWLIGHAAPDVDPDDAASLARIMLHRCSGVGAPHRLALGLEPDETAALVQQVFPDTVSGWVPGTCFGRHAHLASGDTSSPCCARLLTAHPDHGRFSRSLMDEEEADLCTLFISHGSRRDMIETIFARMIARACLEPDHLWQCLGLSGRQELASILYRRFHLLYVRNVSDMRWKRFFYKILCDIEKVWACASPTCAICLHRRNCYGLDR